MRNMVGGSVKNMRQQIIDDWKQFFSENKEQILAKVVRIEDLPPDDEWFNDEYDERGNNETI